LMSTAGAAMRLGNFQYPKQWRKYVTDLREQLEQVRDVLKSQAIAGRDEARPEVRS
jgi:hypothetical protein